MTGWCFSGTTVTLSMLIPSLHLHFSTEAKDFTLPGQTPGFSLFYTENSAAGTNKSSAVAARNHLDSSWQCRALHPDFNKSPCISGCWSAVQWTASQGTVCEEREFAVPPSYAKVKQRSLPHYAFYNWDVVKLSQIIIISDRFDNSFDIKTRVLFVFRRSEMTNEPTVSSQSCLSPLIYLPVFTVR